VPQRRLPVFTKSGYALAQYYRPAGLRRPLCDVSRLAGVPAGIPLLQRFHCWQCHPVINIFHYSGHVPAFQGHFPIFDADQ
jgi:hypothetical protein